MDRYEVKRKIGQGSFGNVYLTIHRKTRRTLVLKEIKVSRMNNKERADVAKEVELLSKLCHPNIVQYVDSFSDNIGSFYIVMEYCDGGDLYMKINRQRGRLLPENVVLTYFVQICRAVQYIHERKILHRDIKSQNIFLVGRASNQRMVKLGDFGIAKIMDGTTEYAKTCIGTPYYLSPEIWEKKPFTNKSDIWSLGCVLYELTTLKHAFEAGCLKNLMLKILKGSYPPVSSKYSHETRNLIQLLLKKNPKDRPSLNTILRKKFLEKIEMDMHKPKAFLQQAPQATVRVQNQSKKVQNVYNNKNSRGNLRRNSDFRDIEIGIDRKLLSLAALKRQNPFIQLLAEGKKLREETKNSNGIELSEEEYLQKLKEIRMMNAQERKHLYEKYGRARSSLAKFEANHLRPKLPEKKWIDLADILNNQSGRRTVNSDTFIINDLKLEPVEDEVVKDISEEDNDDDDVTMVPIKASFKAPEESFSSSDDSCHDPHESLLIMGRRRSSGVLDALKNLICLGKNNSIVIESMDHHPESPVTEETSMDHTNTESNTEELSPAKTDKTQEDILEDIIDDNQLLPIDETPEIQEEIKQLCDIPEEDEPKKEDYFKYLSRSFSLPNLTFTPLESLLPTADEILGKDNFNYSDDFELESNLTSRKSRLDDDEMWHENLPPDPTSSSNIFAFLEGQRAILEEKLGTATLLKVYKMISKLEQSEDDQIDYTDLIKVLGKGNEDLIDDIIQLVVADQFFH